MATVYEIVTEKILEQLAAGVVPWRKPWMGGADGMPRNLVSGKPYRGVNLFLLGTAGFRSPAWLTFRQAAALGGSVRKGERSTLVVFWKVYDRREQQDGDAGDGDTARRTFVLRYFNVFNTEQCDGLEVPMPAGPAFEPIAECERIVTGMPNAPRIEHGGGRACYIPSLDRVQMPHREAFASPAEYYSTLFHEVTHSTSHVSRLGRSLEPGYQFAPFGSPDYSREELVAEMGAAFLCGAAGIEAGTLANSAAYIEHWRQKLQSDAKAVVVAAAQAQRASDYILDRRAAGEEPLAEAA